MFELRRADEADEAFWTACDAHIARDELARKIRDGRCFLILEDAVYAGVLRFNLFWDEIPFLTLLYLNVPFRGRGLGRKAVRAWEDQMRAAGYPCALTSTQSDEGAQHFYRKLGYRDAGCLILNLPTLSQPAEIFLIRDLGV